MNILKNKKIVGGIVGVILLGLVYYVWTSSSSTALLSDSSTQTSPISQEILTTLSSLHTITLEKGKTIFTDPIFVSLTDYSKTLPAEPAGRRNPFAPVDFSQLSSATTTPGR
ncbi:hypothetical protein EXS62_00090 [Candidatus Kaiserbacteria bacterium]|nr:hypothetical protein [Candidatus Kaiserbacteria bacterium]